MADTCACRSEGVMVFPCSGAADVGELADRVARKMARCGQAKIFCLAAVGGHIADKIETVKAAKKLISIDGCPASCAKKTLEHAGFTPIAFNLTEMGFVKGKVQMTDDTIEQALSKIAGGTVEKTDRNVSGGCCGR